MFVGHSLIANHIGPYSQEGVWQISSAHNSGEASAAFEVDLNGLVTGNALAFTWSNEFRPLSWATLSVLGAGMNSPGNSYTYDGIYEMYLQPSRYYFTISSPGAIAQSWSASISGGQMGVERSVNLEQSNIPVPEFRGATLVAVSALAASIYVLRRRYN